MRVIYSTFGTIYEYSRSGYDPESLKQLKQWLTHFILVLLVKAAAAAEFPLEQTRLRFLQIFSLSYESISSPQVKLCKTQPNFIPFPCQHG